MKPVQIMLPPDLAEALDGIGAGNVSEGVRVVTLAWLESNQRPPRELQVWRHSGGGGHYLIAWQGWLVGAAGPMPLEDAQAIAAGQNPGWPVWPDVVDWADTAWDGGEMERVGGSHE